MASRTVGNASEGDKMGCKGGMKEGSFCFNRMKMILERQFAPVLVFSFYKKDREA